APPSLAAAAEAPAHWAGGRAPGPRCGQDAALSAGVLRSPDVRLDGGRDARAVTVERGRAGAVRRVHLAPEPMRVLNGRSRRGRVAGSEARTQERQAGRRGADGLAQGAP